MCQSGGAEDAVTLTANIFRRKPSPLPRGPNAFQGMESTRQFFYNAWFMWVHPPLLYFSYGAFTVSFVTAIQMVVRRHSRFETAAYRWLGSATYR